MEIGVQEVSRNAKMKETKNKTTQEEHNTDAKNKSRYDHTYVH